MFNNTPETTLEWISSVPGVIPVQSVIFEQRSDNEAMHVVRAIDNEYVEGGLYETNKSCAEYFQYYPKSSRGPKCVSTFEFLIIKDGE